MGTGSLGGSGGCNNDVEREYRRSGGGLGREIKKKGSHESLWVWAFWPHGRGILKLARNLRRYINVHANSVRIQLLVSLGLLAFTARSRRVFFPDTKSIRHERLLVHGIEVFLGPNLARAQRTFCFDAVGLVAIGPFYDILVVILLGFSTVNSADVCAHVCTWVGQAV